MDLVLFFIDCANYIVLCPGLGVNLDLYFIDFDSYIIPCAELRVDLVLYFIECGGMCVRPVLIRSLKLSTHDVYISDL